MAYENRILVPIAFGTLSAAADNAATTLQSTDWSASIPTGLTTAVYVPITLYNSATKTQETVYATGYTGSSNLTVVRAQEGSSALPWPAGTTWIVGPTPRDVTPALSTAQRNAWNAHVGARVNDTDLGRFMDRTKNQGWRTPVMGDPSGFSSTGGVIPGDMVPVMRSIRVSANASTINSTTGCVRATWPLAFPNLCMSAFAILGTGGLGVAPVLQSFSTTDAVFRINRANGNWADNGDSVVMHALAIGY